MDIHLVDPRDQTEEIDRPDYRVYFWTSASVSEEYEVRDAGSVVDVLSWAEDVGGDRKFVLYLRVPSESGVTLARLDGEDPSAR